MKLLQIIINLILLNSLSHHIINAHPTKNKKSQKMILILADGIRYDYLNDEKLIGFNRMAKNGVRAEYVQPIFPANSYPNWYTIVTGLFGESHGMVQNFMYDPVEKETFLMSPHPNASHPHWWNQAEPIWITAEKNNVKTAVFWWDGCQVKIRDKEPTFCLEYQSYWTWPTPNEDTLDALNETLDNFQDEEWRLALFYYEAIDAMGHAFGSESQQRINAVRDLDKILNTLQDEIERRNMQDEVNVVVVSDHGMLEVNAHKNTKLIDIENIVDENDVQIMLDRGTTSFLIPNPGKEDKVYEALAKANVKGLNFYRKKDIPDKYHIKNNRRTAPILLVADKGYFVRGFSHGSKTKPVWNLLYSGHHGYDPYDVKEMRTIMYGRGPGLKKNYTNKPIMMTDHYNYLCYLIGIKAQPNNGSWATVKDMTSDSGIKAKLFDISSATTVQLLITNIVLLLIVIKLII